jgi:hypothetical protein
MTPAASVRGPKFDSRPGDSFVDRGFRDFPQFLQPIMGQFLKTGNDSFLSRYFQFTIHNYSPF